MKQIVNISTIFNTTLKDLKSFIATVCTNFAVQKMQQQQIPIPKSTILKFKQ